MMITIPQVNSMPTIKVAESFTPSALRNVATDRCLSLEARGLLLFVLSADQPLRPEDLQQGTGRDKTYKILQELEQAHYFNRQPVRDQGRFTGWLYCFSDSPLTDFQEVVSQPLTDFQEVVNDIALPEHTQPLTDFQEVVSETHAHARGDLNTNTNTGSSFSSGSESSTDQNLQEKEDLSTADAVEAQEAAAPKPKAKRKRTAKVPTLQVGSYVRGRVSRAYAVVVSIEADHVVVRKDAAGKELLKVKPEDFEFISKRSDVPAKERRRLNPQPTDELGKEIARCFFGAKTDAGINAAWVRITPILFGDKKGERCDGLVAFEKDFQHLEEEHINFTALVPLVSKAVALFKAEHPDAHTPRDCVKFMTAWATMRENELPKQQMKRLPDPACPHCGGTGRIERKINGQTLMGNCSCLALRPVQEG